MMNGHVTPTIKTHSFHTTTTGEKFATEKKKKKNAHKEIKPSPSKDVRRQLIGSNYIDLN